MLVVKSLHEVSGCIGGNVTLPSGADPSWILSKIEWSIFTNTTWIATFSTKTTNVDRWNQYKGRLTLNQNSGKNKSYRCKTLSLFFIKIFNVKVDFSGDLTIRDLRQEDAMNYTVELLNKDNENKVNKIRLKVKRKCSNILSHLVLLVIVYFLI